MSIKINNYSSSIIWDTNALGEKEVFLKIYTFHEQMLLKLSDQEIKRLIDELQNHVK